MSLHADGKLIAVHDELRAQFPFIAKDIHEGANGTIWIAADTGLLALSDHGVRKYTVADGLPATVVVEIYPDGDDALWVGTAGGLARVVDGRVTSLAASGGVLRQDHPCSAVRASVTQRCTCAARRRQSGQPEGCPGDAGETGLQR